VAGLVDGPVSWSFPEQGLSGASCAIVKSGRTELFVKWLNPSAGREAAGMLACEARAYARVAAVPDIPALVAFDAGVLITRAVTANPLACWDAQTLRRAGGTLKALSQVGGSGLARVQDRPRFRDLPQAGRTAVVAATRGDRALARYLLACYDGMCAWPDGEDDVTCHGDAHPGNWILTGAGPALIDLGHLALGPAGFDEAFLATYLNAPTRARLAWLRAAGVDFTLAATVAGACCVRVALRLVPLEDPSPPGRAWATQIWPATLGLARALAR